MRKVGEIPEWLITGFLRCDKGKLIKLIMVNLGIKKYTKNREKLKNKKYLFLL